MLYPLAASSPSSLVTWKTSVATGDGRSSFFKLTSWISANPNIYPTVSARAHSPPELRSLWASKFPRAAAVEPHLRSFENQLFHIPHSRKDPVDVIATRRCRGGRLPHELGWGGRVQSVITGSHRRAASSDISEALIKAPEAPNRGSSSSCARETHGPMARVTRRGSRRASARTHCARA